MARDFNVNGECLVYVKGNGALAAGSSPGYWELGLAQGPVRISPRINHLDVYADSFGPKVPPELLWQLAEVQVRMTLIHFDKDVLNACVVESMAGGTLGDFVAMGTPMGAGQALYASGCHYIGMLLTSPVLNFPWAFNACVLTEQPIDWPLGVDASAVITNWRAIPYNPIPATPPTAYSTMTAKSQPGGQSVLVATGPATSELRSTGTSLFGESTLTAFQEGASPGE